MKRILLAAFAVGLMAMPLAARLWTYRADSTTFEAELVDVKDGNAILKRPDGSQMSVPFTKLSLGDIRYINEELRAAEAGITGSSKNAPATGTSQSQSRPKAAEPAPKADTTVDAAKLRYKWTKGQQLQYRVKIVGEQGDYSENLSGDVTYQVMSVTGDDAELMMTKVMRPSQTTDRVGVIIYPSHSSRVYPPRSSRGPYVGTIRFFTVPETSRAVTLTVNSLGEQSRSKATRNCLI